MLVINLSGRPVRIGGDTWVPYELLDPYLVKPKHGQLTFVAGPALYALAMADLVVLPNLFYCLIYPFNNVAYRRHKRVIYASKSPKLTKMVLKKKIGPIRMTEDAMLALGLLKGHKNAGYSLSRTDPALVYLVELGLFKELYVNYVNTVQPWHIELVNGMEKIVYDHTQ